MLVEGFLGDEQLCAERTRDVSDVLVHLDMVAEMTSLVRTIRTQMTVHDWHLCISDLVTTELVGCKRLHIRKLHLVHCYLDND